MPPNLKDVQNDTYTGILEETEIIDTNKITPERLNVQPRKYIVVWRNVILYSLAHILGAYGLYLCFSSAKIATTIFGFFIYMLGAFGTTGGAHRLWSHRSFKATWQLRLFLMICQTISVQNSIIQWVRDHRLHHKYLDTDADPHCYQRGMFFSHAGWLLTRKHPEVKKKGALLDLSDLYADPIVRWQHKHFNYFVVLVGLIIPTLIPMFFWNETFLNAYCVNFARLAIELNATWTVNSIAHFIGMKPYDKNMSPTETLFVSFIAIGEGWHNYHHAFPWDYKASEFKSFNLTLRFIDLFAKIGWAYDMKTVSPELVRHRVKRTGDGSHHIWGWGDKDQTSEEVNGAILINKKN
ncbi:acyl-CoA Delta-9 desaturase-like [Anthonomus grandis grandis]|uniref:acyl-CoA Delta-9 desaturase-like n=1 Tax=Anthonomus grandis grandis TaxID=2921223 RepID=UPI00216590B7|nr:acyl-CoA Delta-9 desaturase-like [Anthonomus grandis grandis]XP_050307148.1 acyl-CoA Delta-9 desaturase-like [Anthonomus grandis grandis]